MPCPSGAPACCKPDVQRVDAKTSLSLRERVPAVVKCAVTNHHRFSRPPILNVTSTAGTGVSSHHFHHFPTEFSSGHTMPSYISSGTEYSITGITVMYNSNRIPESRTNSNGNGNVSSRLWCRFHHGRKAAVAGRPLNVACHCASA